MGFFMTDADTEDLLVWEERALRMPDGSVRAFHGFKLMWRAYEFLIVIGRWEPEELAALALRVKAGENIAGTLPAGHRRKGCVSILQIQMLESPRLDPTTVRLPPGRTGALRSLDDCLHEVVALLYAELQNTFWLES